MSEQKDKQLHIGILIFGSGHHQAACMAHA